MKKFPRQANVMLLLLMIPLVMISVVGYGSATQQSFSKYALRGAPKTSLFDDRIRNPDHLTIMSIATNGYSADALLESLHRPGDWSAEKITLITDNCRPAPGNLANIVEVPRADDSWSKRIQAKLFKMRLFDYTNSSRVLFSDADISVTGSIKEYLNQLDEWDPQCNAYMQVYPVLPFISERSFLQRIAFKAAEIYDPKYSRWNSGLILLDNHHSKELLSKWKTALESGDFGMDQQALAHVMKLDEELKLCPLPDEMFLQASFAGKINRYFFKTTFVHETSSNKEKYHPVCT